MEIFTPFDEEYFVILKEARKTFTQRKEEREAAQKKLEAEAKARRLNDQKNGRQHFINETPLEHARRMQRARMEQGRRDDEKRRYEARIIAEKEIEDEKTRRALRSNHFDEKIPLRNSMDSDQMTKVFLHNCTVNFKRLCFRTRKNKRGRFDFNISTVKDDYTHEKTPDYVLSKQLLSDHQQPERYEREYGR